jgi:hypothetical protein
VLTSTDIDGALRELARRLDARGVRAHIRVVGGAALSLSYADRAVASDVDAAFTPIAEIVAVAREIAKERGWPDEWLNNHAGKFIPIARDDWLAFLSVGGVEIVIAGPHLLLAMKLLSSRIGRDDIDIAYLVDVVGVTAEEQAEEVFETFLPGEVLSERAIRILRRVLEGR